MYSYHNVIGQGIHKSLPVFMNALHLAGVHSICRIVKVIHQQMVSSNILLCERWLQMELISWKSGVEVSVPGSVCFSEQNTLLASLYTSTIPRETDGVYTSACNDLYPM